MNTVGQILIFSFLKTITAIVFSTTLLFPQSVFAQWQDTFADGEFLSDPAWVGDVDAFAIEDERLRLNAAEAGVAVLATQSAGAYGIWEFEIRLDFNPSGTNLTRIYLISDQADLSAPLDGYFILVGGAADEISLYKQTGSTRIKVIDGTDGRVNLPAVAVKIRVTRSPEGNWRIRSQLENETSFLEEGNVIDNEFKESSWFGVQCIFTSTRRDRFYFDNFSFESGFSADTIPPNVLAVEAVGPDRIHVVFSESIPENILSNPGIFGVSDGIGHPIHVEPLAGNTAVNLLFSQEFHSNISYTLMVGPIFDIAGNESPVQEHEFRFIRLVKAIWKDVIISELFCDPSPSVGLPEEEFVEIFNRSPNALSLANWSLSDLTGFATIQEAVILPGEYVILTPPAALTSYQTFGKTLGLTRFPSLNNAGDAITLKDATGTLIDSIYYDDSWYRDSEKKSGGWTLEIIDPENVCAERENWSASENDMGGTPGATNSIYAEKPDLTGPRLTQGYAVSSKVINLAFNEKLENRVPDISQFEFFPGMILESVILNSNLRELDLHLAEPIEPGKIYTVSVRSIYDCAGNIIVDGHNAVEFALAEPPDSHDVVINEILFNPRPNGVDFVELANRSDKYLDLNGWKIGQMVDGMCTNLKTILSKPHFLKPDSILTFTPNAENIRNEYPGARNLLETALPAFNDNFGSVCIADVNGNIVDHFHYSADMHSPFLRNKEGVSLERLSMAATSDDPANWKSAASSAGFATPGYVNSNSIFFDNTNSEIRVEPEVFMAVNGAPDFATIHYAFQQTNQVANIRIMDSRGRLVKTVAQNALLGASGFFRWEGDQDDGARARVGNYMVRVELFDQTGLTRVIMKRVVVAGDF